MDQLIQELTMLEYTGDMEYVPPCGTVRHILERIKYGVLPAQESLAELNINLEVVDELISMGKDSFTAREAKRLIEEAIRTVSIL